MNQHDNYEFHRERMEEEGEKLAKELQPDENDLHIKAGLVFAGWDSDGDMEWIGTERQWQDYEDLDNDIPGEIINELTERD